MLAVKPESGCKFCGMTDPHDGSWTEGTATDLVADAQALGVEKVSVRMVGDWVTDGLLANPQFRKSTRHGSDERAFTPEQRWLFTELLKARQRSPLKRVPQRVLVRPVLYLWLLDDTVVPTEQARRAWSTYARATGLHTALGRRRAAEQLVEQFAHPTATHKQRRTALLLIEAGEKSRRPDWAKLASVLTQLASPWIVPGSRGIERSLGPVQLPATATQIVALWFATHQVTRRLLAEGVDEKALEEARSVFRPSWADYQAQRSAMVTGAGELGYLFDSPVSAEGQVKETVGAFVGELAGVLGLIGKAAGAAAVGQLPGVV
ncbi:hypothetical protein [Kitasatospora brasiliensis]|uniref:hypothetical protein n=1 Tax=Kitasatospora brasiliensis TaxID=3058040 RepID=UPI002931ED66|nr:hypothetical protein [Kitasatospora sp. K002]